ncbi:MAG: hypothetical protein J6U36_01530 [Oscillospiraceae bacterium]|nr:hypothetical protein [Oscillospiraceae bacterium]MBP1592740.1 hypothetical protein [Oscillospiraceae bacterium]
MSFIERPRFSCMLGGALATLTSLPRVIPIIHGAQGCGGQLTNSFGFGGYLGVGYCGGASLPSSNVSEREIVFGGAERLKKEIEAAYEVMDGDLFVVVTSCMTDLIGDDVESVINETERPENPLVYVDTGGFKGNSYHGYDSVMTELFKQFITVKEKKDPKRVNLLGLVPAYDPFFRGDLEEIRRVLKLIGVEATTFFTADQTIEDVRNAGAASLNILFSPLYGIRAAKAAKQKHGIDYHITNLPVGSEATVKFVLEIAEKLGIDKEEAEKALEGEVSRYYQFVDRASDVIADTDFQNYAVVINNSTEALSYALYLDNEIGWLPEYIFITDDLSEPQKQIIRERFEAEEFSNRPELVFETDTFKIQQYITQNRPQFRSETYFDTLSPVFVLGSTIDRKLSQVLGGNFLNTSFPVISRIIINHTYAGFNGGLALLEDLITGQVSGR